MTIDRVATHEKPERHTGRLIIGVAAFAIAVVAAIPVAWAVIRVLWEAGFPWAVVLFIGALVVVGGYGVFGARLVGSIRRRREMRNTTRVTTRTPRPRVRGFPLDAYQANDMRMPSARHPEVAHEVPDGSVDRWRGVTRFLPDRLKKWAAFGAAAAAIWMLIHHYSDDD
jgi:hypothetical protein